MVLLNFSCEMAEFVPDKLYFRHAMLLLFHFKKKAAECQRMLAETYGERAPTIRTVETWYRRFKSGDFDMTDADRSGRPSAFADDELQAILDEDATQTQEMMARQLNVSQAAISQRLHAMGKIQKLGKWVPHELNDRQMENRKTTCRILLARQKRKSFLHRIVTGDEKWILFDNPKRQKSWVDPGQPSTSTAKPNRFGKKAMLCVWWDSDGIIYYELLKPGETVNAERYQQQMTDLYDAVAAKRPKYADHHHSLILLHDNAPAHSCLDVRNYVHSLGWELLPHAAYSPDLAPSDYHLFLSMSSALAEQHFNSFDEIKIWLAEWFESKDRSFYWRGIHKLQERWEKCIASDGAYFE